MRASACSLLMPYCLTNLATLTSGSSGRLSLMLSSDLPADRVSGCTSVSGYILSLPGSGLL